MTLRSFLVTALCLATAAMAQITVPEIDIKARVKQHRAGAAGDLVAGEEELRKVIIQWDKVDGATGYEVCHNCKGDVEKIIPVEVGRKGECGGRPCMVLPGAPIGYNTFQLRVKTSSGVSDWGSARNFKVQDVGHVEHEEL